MLIHDEAAYSQSFRGKLYMRVDGNYIPTRLSTSRDKWTWGLTPQDDWLQAGGDRDSFEMYFKFRSKSASRLHYSIYLTERPAAQLDVSLNGYLGFYQLADVINHWKLEPLEWTEQGLLCTLRDYQGQRVAAIADDPHFSGHRISLLNVKDGEVHQFLVKRTR